jgi:hypothetical protein
MLATISARHTRRRVLISLALAALAATYWAVSAPNASAEVTGFRPNGVDVSVRTAGN